MSGRTTPKASTTASAVLDTRLREIARDAGVSLMAQTLFVIIGLLELRGAYRTCLASRRTLGRMLAEAVNRDRPYSESQVNRCQQELVGAELIRVRRRWDKDFILKLTALRQLTSKVHDALARMAGERSKRRAKKRAGSAPAEDGRPRPELQPVWSKVVGGCPSCRVVTPAGSVEELHLPGCPNAPP